MRKEVFHEEGDEQLRNDGISATEAVEDVRGKIGDVSVGEVEEIDESSFTLI